DGAAAQIFRGVRLIAQHGQYVARFERWAYAPPYGLQALRDEEAYLQPELLGDRGHVFAQRLRRLGGAHFRRRSHRHFEDAVRGARGDLFGKDRGDQLALSVDVERALYADE